MPQGMVVWQWNERIGAQVLAKYPNEIILENKTLMQLYSQHLYSARADIVSLYIGALNLISIWTGSVYNYFLSVLLTPEENEEDYRGLISDVMSYLVPYLEQNSYGPIIASIYHRIAEFAGANDEQKMAMIYTSDVNRAILSLLQEEGVFYKDELVIWLEERLKTKLFNFDMLIERLGQLGFLKTQTIEGISGTFLFLLRHLMIFRSPPTNVDEMLKDYPDPNIKQQFSTEIRKYFQYYNPSERDAVELASIMADQSNYRIISYLRKTLATREGLNKLRMHGVDTPLDRIKELENQDIIMTLKSNTGELLYALKTDIVIDTGIPEYILQLIYETYKDHRKSNPLLLAYLDILKITFNEKQSKERKARRAEHKRLKEESRKIQQIKSGLGEPDSRKISQVLVTDSDIHSAEQEALNSTSNINIKPQDLEGDTVKVAIGLLRQIAQYKKEKHYEKAIDGINQVTKMLVDIGYWSESDIERANLEIRLLKKAMISESKTSTNIPPNKSPTEKQIEESKKLNAEKPISTEDKKKLPKPLPPEDEKK
jgi:hypothetical protein